MDAWGCALLYAPGVATSIRGGIYWRMHSLSHSIHLFELEGCSSRCPFHFEHARLGRPHPHIGAPAFVHYSASTATLLIACYSSHRGIHFSQCLSTIGRIDLHTLDSRQGSRTQSRHRPRIFASGLWLKTPFLQPLGRLSSGHSLVKTERSFGTNKKRKPLLSRDVECTIFMGIYH